MLADEFEDELGETDALPRYLQTTMPPTPNAPLGGRVPLVDTGRQKVDEYGLPV